jgi:hypothetical protein
MVTSGSIGPEHVQQQIECMVDSRLKQASVSIVITLLADAYASAPERFFTDVGPEKSHL